MISALSDKGRNTRFCKALGSLQGSVGSESALRWPRNQNPSHPARPARSQTPPRAPPGAKARGPYVQLWNQADSRTQASLSQRQGERKAAKQVHLFKTSWVDHQSSVINSHTADRAWPKGSLLSPLIPAPAPTSPASHPSGPKSGC